MTVNSKFAATGSRFDQYGFTLLQTLVVVAIVGVVTAFGFIGISNARAEIRLQNSARRFAVHIEKARLDSIRRHAAVGGEAVVQTFNPGTNTYAITMDFNGTGGVQTRTFTLDEGISFGTNGQTVTFDWRGRIPQRAVFGLTNGRTTIPVDVSGSGDITLGNQTFADDSIPDVALNPVPPDVVPDPTPYPTVNPSEDSPGTEATPTPTPTPTPNGNGNGNGNGGNGNGNPHSTPTPTPTPTPQPTVEPTPDPTGTPFPCSASTSTSSLSLSQRASGQQSGTVSFTLNNATGTHSVTAAQAGSGNNLTITVSPSSISGSGSAIITIASKNGSGNRGNFTVNISAGSCGSVQQVIVTVGN